MTPDVNVLIAASRTDHPHHQIARGWLEGILHDEGRVELLPMVVAGFLRLVTNRRVFPYPTPIEDAIAFLDAVLGYENVVMETLGGEWPTLRSSCLEGNLCANAIPDAWIAAAVRVLQTKLVTFDKDFARLLDSHQVEILKCHP